MTEARVVLYYSHNLTINREIFYGEVITKNNDSVRIAYLITCSERVKMWEFSLQKQKQKQNWNVIVLTYGVQKFSNWIQKTLPEYYHWLD